MGVELLEIGVKVRKGVIFTIRGCFRTVCSHPFLVGMLCFLIFLYRSSPFIFHLLVSTSPILVCTAVLLGTLLSFGQPNIPEIEFEEKIEAASIKSGVLGDATVVEENENHFVDRFDENSWRDEAGKSAQVRREEDLDDTAPLIKERSRGSEASGGEERGGKRELDELRYKEKGEWIEERLNNGDAKVNGEVESDDEKSEADSFDSEKVNVDSLDSPPLSPWARVEEREEEEKERDEDEEESLDSGSDCAESSSPDASMADIMPMLDELHPLLDEEGGPQNARLSRGSSDVASEKSLKSSHQSDDESENHEHLEANDDENEDGEDEEEDAHGDKDEETKSAITWTEQDQKNLMDLGSSEIERNQRLENLIMRRRARKSTNSSLFAERNLIDLESTDLPFNIAPISTRRQNPFDLPQDSYDDSGLPPIPGSAPSVMLQRRNPFDIPYDSSEEKPDLKGDVFQEEFTSQPREPFFRRHERFNVGPSMFAPKRQDVKMRPYFVPERTISEESSSSLFQRQSSGLSDSKASSIPETESFTSVEDMEDKKLPETDSLPEREVVEQARDIAEEGPSRDPELISREEEDTGEMISKMESVSEHIGHGSQSSGDEDYLELAQVEKRDDQVGESQNVEAQGFGHGSTLGAVESRYSRDSSSSSLSEVSERVFIDTEGEGLSMVEGSRDFEEPSISSQTSLGSSDLNITSALAIDITQRAPVYDSSPRGLGKNAPSSSSVPCDVLPVGGESSSSVPCDVLPVGGESERNPREIETDITRNIEMLPDSSMSQSIAAESRPADVVDIRDQENMSSDLSRNTLSRSHGEASMEEHLVEKHESDEVSVSADDKNIHGLIEVSETQLEGLPRTAERSNSIDETVEPPSDSDGDNEHEADEKLISMLPSEGNTSLFYESAIQEPDFNYLNEVQASSTQVESFLDDQFTHDLNVPEVQELDGYANSPSSAIETNSYRFDVQTVVEEADEIKEIDEGLLCELDNVGDFSIGQLGSGTNEFEKRVDSVGEESLSSTHHVIRSVGVSEMEQFLLPEESRGNIDVYEQEAAEHVSEIQTYQTSRAENLEVIEKDPDSPHQETSDEETLSTENEFMPGDSFVNHNHEDAVSGIPEMEVQSVDVATKGELASVETEVMVEVAEVSCQGQLDTDTTFGMPEIEASSIEDIDLAFKQTSSEEIEKHVVLDPPQAELQNHEVIVSAVPESDVDAAPTVAEVPSSDMIETESSTVEDIELAALKQMSSEASENPRVLEPVDADTPLIPELEDTKAEEDIDLASTKISSVEIEKHVVLEPPQAEDTDCGTPEQEVLLAEDVPKHTEVAVASADVSSQDQAHTLEFTEIEASTVEEIDLAFEHIISKAIEKPVDFKPVDTESTSGMPEIEASSVEAIHQAFQHIGTNEIKDRDVGETITEDAEDTAPHSDMSEPVSTNKASLLEVGPSDGAEANGNQTAIVDHALPVVESRETQGASSELHIVEAVPLEGAVSDGETREQLKLKSDDESGQVKADDKVGPSEEKSSLSSAFEGERPNHDDEAVEDLHSPSSGKGKGKLSRSSSSCSSSSSDSSSSDSDREDEGKESVSGTSPCV